ncbi:MAG: glycosyltransferase [Actinobacteria bacterium]|nr:glycosyltransferase [Actinomycetota bacterium]
MERLTVVIPTYNRPCYLRDCLHSVASQTLRDFKVVVLDNASTEDYGPVLEKFEALDIEYHRNPENIGAIGNNDKAREIGSRSTYHVIFHDDDLMHPEMLRCQLEALDKMRNLQWVATECAAFTSDSMPDFSEASVGGLDLEVYEDPAALVRVLLANVPLNFGSVMFRSQQAPQPIRGDEFQIVADRILLTDLAALGPVALIREPLVLYRHHEGQDSHNPVFREHHALSLMKYYRDALPAPLSARDESLLLKHGTNYLLHARSVIGPSNRKPLSSLIGDARREGLFRWRAIDGQGVAAIARLAGLEGPYSAIRPVLGRVRRLVQRA